MANWKKLAQGAAGAAGAGEALNVEDVFSTYLYTGTNTTNAINNGIDLDGESGIVWIKNRDQADNHYIFGGESGNNWTKLLTPNGNGYYGGATSIFDSVSSTGFTVKSDFGGVNTINENYVSWTFRKAPKFFDVVTYTGNGTSQTISHNLGSDIGFMLVKKTSGTGHWIAWHKDFADTAQGRLILNLTSSYNYATTYWNNTAPTSTEFTVGSNVNTNESGATYVAYIFAHNDDDGEFGPNGDADIIKCGSYTGDGTEDGSNEIDLGFEPQWVMIKRTNASDDWIIFDTMRGWVTGRSNNQNKTQVLFPNAATAEVSDALSNTTSTGFMLRNNSSKVNANGSTYIYMAIRRGPMAVPTDADDVFAVDQGDGTTSDPQFISDFPVDIGIWRHTNSGNNWETSDRLRGPNYLRTNSDYQELGDNDIHWDYMDGFFKKVRNTSFYAWMWRRAPSFCDVVAYKGNGTDGRTVSHNLGVTPEMMWVKSRSNAYDWLVYHKDLGNATYSAHESWLKLNGTNAQDFDTEAFWNGTAPTSSVFSLNGNNVNQNNSQFVAYLFASLDGVSKVGSYTGDGNTEQNIDCGFSSGARFVLIKKISYAGNWFLFDSVRGIISGNSPYLELNTTSAQGSSYNELSPYSSGFTVRNGGGLNLNFNGHTFIFYAIA